MPAPVVVEVTAASPEPPALQAMVEACARAVGYTSCVLARQAPEPPYAAVAIVTFLGKERVRVEVGLHAGARSQWRSRDLAFRATDLELERFRAIGFVVGSLASSARSEPESALAAETGSERLPGAAGSSASTGQVPARAAPPPPARAEPAREPDEDESEGERATHRRAWVGLGWASGDGLDSRLERNGAYGRFGFRPGEAPLFVCASLGYGTTSHADAVLSTTWLDAGLGLGVAAVDSRAITLDLALEVVGERFSALASDPFQGSADRSRWIGVTRARAELGWYWSELVGASAFGEALARGGNTEVSVDGTVIGQTATLGYSFGLGLGLRLAQ